MTIIVSHEPISLFITATTKEEEKSRHHLKKVKINRKMFNNNSEKTKKEKRQHNVVASGVVQSDETALKTVRPTNNKFSTVENIPFTHTHTACSSFSSSFFSSCSFVRVSTKEEPLPLHLPVEVLLPSLNLNYSFES